MFCDLPVFVPLWADSFCLLRFFKELDRCYCCCCDIRVYTELWELTLMVFRDLSSCMELFELLMSFILFVKLKKADLKLLNFECSCFKMAISLLS